MSRRPLVGQTSLSAVAFLCFICHPSALSLCLAGTVRTLDGQTYTGDIRLDTGGQLLVTPTDGTGIKKIDLDEVLQATLGPGETAQTAAAKIAPAIRTEAGQLPAPWRATDIGALSEKGYAKFTNEGQVFSVKSAGGNIGGADDDAFCFVNQPATGDLELSARLMPITSDPKQVVQGLMIRSSADPGATYAAILYVAGDLRFFKRTRTGQATDAGTVGAARAPLPVSMRLSRRGDTITAAWSRDNGATWQPLGSETLPMRATGALAGIACCGRAKQPMGAHVTNLRLTAIAPAQTGDDAATTAAAATTAPRPIKEGLTLRSGTHLAGAQIDKADDSALHFTKGDHAATLSLAAVARIVYRELPPETAAGIPEKRAGVLLKEGDFIEGAFKGLQRGQIQLSSVLFGLARFTAREKAVAVVLNDLDPNARPKIILRTRDGSTYVARAVAPERDKLIVEDPIAGQFTINRQDVTEISAGQGRLQPLTTLKPEKVDPPTQGDIPTLATHSTGQGFTLTAGAAASWNLAREYRTFTFKAGVPQGILPTAAVCFVVLGDDKELYKSRPLTSLDDPLSTSLTVKGITTLTLKVEPATPNPLPTPGLWADPALVK